MFKIYNIDYCSNRNSNIGFLTSSDKNQVARINNLK
jgi:hypothetical protein